jgi:putative transposase
MEFETLFHCSYSLHLHLVLVTKYRRRLISKPMLSRLEEILDATCGKWNCRLLEFNGDADHVHLLLAVNPTVQPSKLVNNLKTVSSRRIRKEYPSEVSRAFRKPVFWSRTYCLISCGGAPLSVIRQYIEAQDGAA